MAGTQHHDPYALQPEHVREPPRAFGGIVRLIGPGLILASSIVGSGELIATTVLGAENGYILLWLIIMSCLVKTVVQNELGRYAIGTGKTTLEAFNEVPGPRLKVSWLVWMWCAMVTVTLFQVGAMLGGTSEILHRQFPGVPITVFVWLLAVGTMVLLIIGKYVVVERIAMGPRCEFHRADRELLLLAVQAPGVLQLERGPDGTHVSAARRRDGHGGGGVRNHRGWRHRTGHVPLLVHREGLCQIRWPPRRLAPAGHGGPWAGSG